MSEAVQREIHELHAFFEGWFRGEVPDSPETFDRCTGALDAAFRLITPAGTASTREQILEAVRSAHGSRAGSTPPFRIWIERFECRPLGVGRELATYEEWHDGAEGRRGRLSTALFRIESAAPNGVVWEHVHETWLPA